MASIFSGLKKTATSFVMTFFDSSATPPRFRNATYPKDYRPEGVEDWPPTAGQSLAEIPVPPIGAIENGGVAVAPFTGLGLPQIAFSQSIPFNGSAFMASPSNSSPLNFTVGAGGVAGSIVYLRLVGNGSTPPPVFTGFKEAQGNLGVDMREGKINIIQFFFDGVDAWVTAYSESTNPAPDQVLSNFAIAADGRFVYAVAGNAITALSGTLTIAGTTRTLTHVSSGIATISGAPLTSTTTDITASITATTPVLSQAATNVPVVNNMPPPGLVKRSISFPAGVTKTGDGYSVPANTAGFTVVDTVNAAAAFEVIYKAATTANVLIFSPTTPPATYAWPPPAGNRLAGGYLNGQLYATSAAAAAEGLGNEAAPRWLKFTKSGDDILMSMSTDGVSAYVLKKTFTGVLAGQSQLYVSIYNVPGTVGAGEISFYA